MWSNFSSHTVYSLISVPQPHFYLGCQYLVTDFLVSVLLEFNEMLIHGLGVIQSYHFLFEMYLKTAVIFNLLI